MTDRKDRQNEQDDKTEKFTGSPEQKFPDLEAEDQQGRQEEQFKEAAGEEKDQEE
ncbi:hypothetical protein [Planococcus beigongshangi]|uniref:hypothetical protein n=1 Tax=Planococcus beigongshangi TaxID=2782536 RepID=UPI00193BE63C|nr:hypothetical protein [Planococcus beigongshangi]